MRDKGGTKVKDKKENKQRTPPSSSAMNRGYQRRTKLASQVRLSAVVKRLGGRSKDRLAYVSSNAEMIQRTVCGIGPDQEAPDDVAGARMVANISNAHVPALCAESVLGASESRTPYKNAYNLFHEQPEVNLRLGGPPPKQIGARRQLVDSALPLPQGKEPKDVYFGALELNGAGVRFYGDVCLVLSVDKVLPDTPILDRNSYDLIRPPISHRWLGERASEFLAALGTANKPKSLDCKTRKKLEKEVDTMAGSWKADRANFASIKVLEASGGGGTRRLSTGQISDGVLDDEDYIEVLKLGTFGVLDLQEVRVAAADVAADNRLTARLQSGAKPSPAGLLWIDRRRTAEKAIASAGPRLSIVTSRGRMK